MNSLLAGTLCMGGTMVFTIGLGLTLKHFFPNAGFDNWREDNV